jgi:hypothetical protein
MLTNEVLTHATSDPDGVRIFAPQAFAPRLLAAGGREGVDSEWAVAGAVAGILGVALGVVIFICSVCAARSFNACMNAVVNWWASGC